jgi:Coenzyme Q (ubiquinone) biosynthesis protein Coq4
MTIDFLRSLSPLRWARVLIAFVRAVKTPDVPHFYELESATWELASPRQLERMAERFRASPDMKHAFEERYFPRTRTVEDASRCAEGTFGRAYFDFMTRNKLSVDYLEARTLEGDLTWFRARQAQAHDQWHTLLGIDPQYGGEVERAARLGLHRVDAGRLPHPRRAHEPQGPAVTAAARAHGLPTRVGHRAALGSPLRRAVGPAARRASAQHGEGSRRAITPQPTPPHPRRRVEDLSLWRRWKSHPRR